MNRPTILLYNPVSGHGHLDSWNAMFVRLLLELGCSVLALTPDAAALSSRLNQRGLLEHSGLTILDWNTSPPLSKSLLFALRRCLGWLRHTGERYTLGLPGGVVTPDMPPLKRWRKIVLRSLAPPVYKSCCALRGLFPGGRIERKSCLLDPEEMGMRVRAAVKAAGCRPALLFNMYLDMYDADPAPWRAFAKHCRLPWAGIRFVPSPDGKEAYYGLRELRGMCFLDETVRSAYAAAQPNRHFCLLPDVTNGDLPPTPPELARAIRQRARGRCVVFLGGSLGGQKNLARFLGLRQRLDPDRFFFVLVGEIHANTLLEADLEALGQIEAFPPENLLLHRAYLHDDHDFNAVIAASDIVFSVYRDFRISSNMLGKAAFFEKPILVASGFLMGQRVDRYAIGLTAPEDDEDAMAQALERLAQSAIPSANFAAYRRDFSEKRLTEHLEKFITSCIRFDADASKGSGIRTKA